MVNTEIRYLVLHVVVTFYYLKTSAVLYNIIWIKKIRFETINSCDYSEELMPNIITSVRSVPADGLVIVKCENMHYTLVTNIVVTAAKA